MLGLIQSIIKAGSDNADHFCKGFEGAYTGGYRIQQDPEEFAHLITALRTRAPFQSALSIGIAAGGNDRFMMENVNIKRLTVVDDGKHPNHGYWAKQNRPAILAPVDEFIGDSHSKAAADFLKGKSFDLVGIDGDHSPAGVRMDWELIQPHLAPGAIVWFHDIALTIAGQTGAAELWAEVRQKHKPILEVRNQFGIGAIQV